MVSGDLHIHSVYSNGYFRYLPPWVASTPEEILRVARERELKVVSITDHDSLEGSWQALRLANKYGIIVVPACEITSKDGHILAFGIKKEIPKKMSADQTIKLIHQQGGLAVAAHPFRVRPIIFNGIGLGDLVLKLPLDGLETASASMTPKVNEKTAQVIKSNHLKMAQTGGSDTHSLDFIGLGRTIFKEKIVTYQDALGAIKDRKTEAEVVEYIPDWKKVTTTLRDQLKYLKTQF